MMLSVLRLQTPARVKVQVTYRVAAKAVDFVIVAAAAAVLPYPLGPLMGFAYSVCADGIRWGPFEAQSLGKRIMRLHSPDEPGCRQADTLAGGDVFRADSSLGLVDSGAGKCPASRNLSHVDGRWRHARRRDG